MWRIGTVIVAIAVSALVIAGETMRCEGRVIGEDDHIFDLLEHCGEPTRRVGNQLFYDRGDGKFITIVTIRGHDQSIARIEQQPND